MPGEGRRRERIGALLVGVREDGTCATPAGSAPGFTEAELDRLADAARAARARRRRRSTRPISPSRRAAPCGSSRATSPRSSSASGRRATSCARRRTRACATTSRADEVVREGGPAVVIREEKDKAVAEVEGREIKVSNLDKVLYPKAGFRKRDVIDYYADIAPVLLPHLEGRPLTLKRYPNGVDGAHFYEKQAPSHRPAWVHTARVPTGSKTIEFVVCDDLPTLVWLANLADLELHTSLARAEDIERPTTLAFDLDPGEPATIVECCRVGLLLEGMFHGLGLQSFPKTSGSKGLQVYVPLNTDVTYDDTKPFAKAVAELLEREEPGPRRLAPDEDAAPRQGARRLEPERRAQDDGERLLAARAGAPDGLDAA